MSVITKSKKAEQELCRVAEVTEISVTMISPNPNQPRKNFNPDELVSLAKSISQDGIVQPLTVRRTKNGYDLVSGERRLRAAKMAGMKKVPCIVVDISEKRSAVVALIENIQRSDLNCFEEARAISLLIRKFSLTQEDAAIRLGMAQSTVANKLRLLKLSDEEEKIITTSGLTERHARALLKVENTETRKQLLAKAAREKLTVSQTERLVSESEKKDKIKKSYEKRAPVLRDIKLFFNTVDKAIEVIKLAGVDAKVKKTKQDGFIEYTIKIPNQN